jgi:hypothetical protein
MKRSAFVVVAMAAALALVAGPASAGHGGGHGGGGFHGGFRGGPEFHGGRDFHGGREFREHEFHHRGFGGPVFIGPSIGWDPFWYPYPAYSYAPPVVIQPEPQVYVQPQAPGYWYYCTEAGAYYPYVQQCPSGWLSVVPTPAQ